KPRCVSPAISAVRPRSGCVFRSPTTSPAPRPSSPRGSPPRSPRPPRDLRPGDRAARVGDGRRLLLPVLRPGRHRLRQCDAVDPDLVDLLVIEGEKVLDLRA